MKKLSILSILIIVLSSCNKSVPGNSIVIGSVRANLLLVSPRIYAMDENGAKKPISVPFSDISNADWSPDGTRIAFVSDRDVSLGKMLEMKFRQTRFIS
jgi:Tol biopolymer transport system component